MTTDNFVAAVILKSDGEVSTAAFGDDDYTKILQLGNIYIGTWEREPGTNWNSLYSPEETLGTISATDTYTIPTCYIYISDKPGDVVRIDHADGTYTTYDIVNADELKLYYEGNKTSQHGKYCAQIGADLVFNTIFASTDAEFGGTIKCPVYNAATRLSIATSIVPVDDANWLVFICAAERTRNNTVKQNQYPNLIAEATEAMKRMKQNNDTAQNDTFERVKVGGGVNW